MIATPANAGFSSPSSSVLVLFNGANLGRCWVKCKRPDQPADWPIDNEGAMTTHDGDIMTRDTFRDFHLHLEFLCPNLPPSIIGQARSNSGVYLLGRYEIQVLDSYGKFPPGKGDCGAIYNTHAPLVNVCAPPDHWQTYDALFRAARHDAAGNKAENARLTLLHNSQVIHNNVEIPGPTGGALDRDERAPGPILLQDHGGAVRYRNLWIVPLPLRGSDHY